ncbi:hypothetical protein K7432_009497 [Basidiobolus ranarum]|uniref:Amidohydrolase-related domain-containing protein n=1 Tax=Basidiobolus ranarum TaxID=34480 RepID=A0ABR2VX10_9FUNG
MHFLTFLFISATLAHEIVGQYVFYGNYIHSVNITTLEYITDGVIVVDAAGKITQVEKSSSESEAKLIAHNHGVNLTQLDNHKFIMPGLIDTHIHAPQYVFTGSGMDLQLLEWLENYTFPREAQFNNTKYATMAYNLAVGAKCLYCRLWI